MRVYKFGGASVKDADAVRNVARIIEDYGKGELWVVISAMGKSTNKLESLLDSFRFEFENREELLQELWEYHEEIMKELFPFGENEVWNEAEALFTQLKQLLENTRGQEDRRQYAEVVSIGELLSTRILSAYLNSAGILNEWVDARELVKTEERPEDAKVDLDRSQKQITQKREELLTVAGLNREGELVVVTQGFIGSSGHGTTTLGREGSDYTGGIIAWSLGAEELSIWKDVPGMLNADPKYFKDAEIIERLSYKEAIELSYFGASVIHPKTIKPLQNKKIPLFVRSFKDPSLPGTVIQADEKADRDRPSYIFKQNQVLISIVPTDFSFIMEDSLSEIFRLMSEHALKANLMQNSALSFSVCIDDKGKRVDDFREALGKNFKVLYNQGLSLITVRHYNEKVIDRLLNGREILVEQRSRQTARYVVSGGFTLST